MTTATFTLRELGQMAFALAVNQACPGVKPEAEKVEFTTGERFHRCCYDTCNGPIFKGDFYRRELQSETDGSIFMREVEYLHSAAPYLHPLSWHHLFGIPSKYIQMKDWEIIEWTGEEIGHHMQQSGQILHLFECLFRDTDKLVDGTTKGQVAVMTRFKKIELLERLHVNREMFGTLMRREIKYFLEGVDKERFRTADDLE